MAQVFREVDQVMICYRVRCGFERATALANLLQEEFEAEGEIGVTAARETSTGFDPDDESPIEVHYLSLQDAVRLDPEVRRRLSRKINYTYESKWNISYGSRGATGYATSKTQAEVVGEDS